MKSAPHAICDSLPPQAREGKALGLAPSCSVAVAAAVAVTAVAVAPAVMACAAAVSRAAAGGTGRAGVGFHSGAILALVVGTVAAYAVAAAGVGA